MKRTSVVLLALMSAPVLFADAPQRLIPAGSLISCTISEPRISSKTTAIGDPVLCQVAHSSRYGHSLMPYRSYLVGRFEDYRDPGHFVGKGWMELRFDRMVIEPDIEIPVEARVVDVPGYRVDNTGRILGKGHAVRDIVTWSIPILWPIDLMMLPARGPRPTLKEETRVTLKVMDDLAVPVTNGPTRDGFGLSHREPTAYNDAPQPPQQPEPMPQMAQTEPPAPQPQRAAYPPAPPSPPQYVYAPAPYVYMPAPLIVVTPQPVYTYVPPVVVSVRPPMVYGTSGYGYAAYPPQTYAPVQSYGYSGVHTTAIARSARPGAYPSYSTVRAY